MEAYIFRAKCTHVVDGDTIDCTVDVGFGMTTRQRFRLWGVNTPEKHSSDQDEKSKAYEAMEFVAALVEGKDVMVQTYKTDVFGRYLAKVFIPEGVFEQTGREEYTSLNDLLILEGLGKPYMTNTDLLE